MVPLPLDGTAVVSDGGHIGYQWQLSYDQYTWSNIPGATGPKFLPRTSMSPVLIRDTTFYRVVATNYTGLYPSGTLYPSSTLYPGVGLTASAVSNTARITIYPIIIIRSDTNMIKFNDKRLYLKGTGNVVLTQLTTGKILYQSDKFSAASINTSVSMNEIRAGLANPVVAILPTDAGLTVELTAQDFSLWEKAAQVGAPVTYGAPVPAAQVVTASGTSLSIDVSAATPVAQLGFPADEVLCYVQQVGVSSLLSVDGTAYALDPTSGAISGFTSTSGVQYKVWYYVNNPNAQRATITTLMDPEIVHMTASFAVYANTNGTATSGTRQGWLYVTVPLLKLQANANINGDQGANDTTVITGMAIADDDDVVSALTDMCGDVGGNLAYYVYSPCTDADAIKGLAVVGGVVSLPKSSTKQIPVKLVMADNSLADPPAYGAGAGFSYAMTTAIAGASVSNVGVITSGTTTGDGEVTVTYEKGDLTWTLPVNVTVTA